MDRATAESVQCGQTGMRRRYFIWKLGARFSLNASGPSLASSDRNTGMPIGGVGLERVVLVHALGLADGLEDRLHRQRAVVVDDLGDLQRLLQCGAVGHHVADQPVLLGLGGGDVSSGEQQIARHGVGDLAHQPHRGAAHRVQAPLGLGDAELGALARNADIGALQDLGATRDGRSLHGGDQRLGQPAALQQGVDARRVVAAVLERVARRFGRRGLEVHARAEVPARAGQDAGPDVGIVVNPVPRLDHDREHLGGKRVASLRAVQRQDQSVSALLNEGVGAFLGLAHGSSAFLHRCHRLVTKCNTF